MTGASGWSSSTAKCPCRRIRPGRRPTRRSNQSLCCCPGFHDASLSFDASGLRCRLSLVDRLDDRADADLAIGEDVRAQTTSMDQPAEHALGGEALQVRARLTQPLA